MTQLPKALNPLVIRTDFEHQPEWETICNLIRAPVSEGGDLFHAYVEFFEHPEFRNVSREELMARTGADYTHSFVLVVDDTTVNDPEFLILVIDLYENRGRSFRATPSRIQSIENNLSIANLDFRDFADAVDNEGVFRGFPKS